MSDRDALLSALGAAGLRLTGPRRALVDLVAGRQGAFTTADLVGEAETLRPPVGRATVFRAIDVLASIGALERVDLPTGEHAYVACEPRHHHHVICTSCGRSTAFGDVGLGELARDVARQTGYRVDEHRLALFGLCPRCRPAGAEGGIA